MILMADGPWDRRADAGVSEGFPRSNRVLASTSLIIFSRLYTGDITRAQLSNTTGGQIDDRQVGTESVLVSHSGKEITPGRVISRCYIPSPEM
jgi:hypothetical protein